MKKTIFALIAVLFLVLMATCEDYGSKPGTDPDDGLPWYTEDGRKMVHLTIGVGSGGADRAMTEALAKGNIDYYEVAFQDLTDATRVYRAAWENS